MRAPNPPSCPKCDSPMALRTARRGRNRGGKFWGCSRYPQCEATRELADTTGRAPPSGPRQSVPDEPPGATIATVPVLWRENAHRADYVPEYLSVGAIPGILQQTVSRDRGTLLALSQCLFLSRRNRRRRAAHHSTLVGGLLAKILQRGLAPLPTLGMEKCALEEMGLLEDVDDLESGDVEVGWRLKSQHQLPVNLQSLRSALAKRDEFVLGSEFHVRSGSASDLFDSSEEALFLQDWVPTALGSQAGHWFTPQAPLDTLLESAGGGEGFGDRRVDYLFAHPGGAPFVVEIDGPEHEADADTDRERDESLQNIGVDVIRVPNVEVAAGGGSTLNRVRQRCQEAFSATRATYADDRSAKLILEISAAAKVQLAIARAVEYGWLTRGRKWEIILTGAGQVAAAGVRDVLTLMAALDRVYGGGAVPALCTIQANQSKEQWASDRKQGFLRGFRNKETLHVAIEPSASPFHVIMPASQRPDILIRACYLPVKPAATFTTSRSRPTIALDSLEDATPSLTELLRQLFRKHRFRDGQAEAIFNVLRQMDSVVLLPTGAGKSLIYQLSGLMMPGITLVVDPLVALIEDQVEGLFGYGIDRAVPITSHVSTREEGARLRHLVERGEYLFVFVSPERLQIPAFRGTLRALAQKTLVNLAVVDEAHCVSEWGHDFRPAYLGLAQNLRTLVTDEDQLHPPVLALTGTASRAVLRDMLADLDIPRDRSDLLIRPHTFDRPELSFRVASTPPHGAVATLRGNLQRLPSAFHLPPAVFFQPNGDTTMSGIVFVPTVNQAVYGLRGVANEVKKAAGASPTMYSGTPPKGIRSSDWEGIKRENARRFKENRRAVLVATKAFGMGIDKPNIRYTIHFGIPSSLENFYQEAGRAGRDGKRAECIMVFSEFDRKRSDMLLDPDLTLPELREQHRRIERDFQARDDVTRALWFHLQSFRGIDRELEEVSQLLDRIGDLSAKSVTEIPFPRSSTLAKSERGKERDVALSRLMRLQVVGDYQVDYGKRRHVIVANRFDYEQHHAAFLDYVRASQPARVVQVTRQLGRIDDENAHPAVLALARLMIEFTYDVIERSRRRMIQEVVRVARRGRSDAEIRIRLLDYLQEGLDAERIRLMLEDEQISFAPWLDLIDKLQTPVEAGELRGLCVRELESTPDHPGLLLARAASESMCSDGDPEVTVREIGSLLQSCRSFRVAPGEVEKAIDGMVDFAAARAPELSCPLAEAILAPRTILGPNLGSAERVFLARHRELKDDHVFGHVATYRLFTAAKQIGRVLDDYDYRTRSPDTPT